MSKDELKDYFSLLELFQSGRITAQEFETRYLQLFKSDNRLFPEAIFEVLNGLFSDVDAFVADPKPRRLNDLDDKQLLASSLVAYDRLVLLTKETK